MAGNSRPGTVHRWLSWLGMSLIATVLSLGLAAPAWSSAADASGWAQIDADEATGLDISYKANADGSVTVTQRVTWDFPANKTRHGYEWLETSRYDWDADPTKYRLVTVTDVTATSSTGAPSKVSVLKMGPQTRIRVGDPNVTVAGTQKYVVTYTLGHVVNDIGDGTAELYVNLFDGSSSTKTFKNVTATVTGPAAPTRVTCYQGKTSSTGKCQSSTVSGGEGRFTFGTVEPWSAATVVAAFPRDAFGDIEPDLRNKDSSEGDSDGGFFGSSSSSWADPLWVKLALILLPGALVGAVLGSMVWFRGRDLIYAGITPGLQPGPGQMVEEVHGKLPTVVQFTPPAGVSPGMVGVIMDERADPIDVSGTVVDLAVRGYLTLSRIEKEGFGARLFGMKEDWMLSAQPVPAVAEPLQPYEQRLLGGLFRGRPQVQLSSLRETFYETLNAVQEDMVDEANRRGWFRVGPRTSKGNKRSWARRIPVYLGMVWLLFPAAAFAGAQLTWLLPLAWGLIGALLIGSILARRLPARSASGSALYAQCRGFKEYLETAEADKIRWEEAQDIFSRYLPYAIVFGVADRWAKTFDEVAAAAAAGGYTITAPIWFGGDPTWNFTGLASSMGDFSTVATGTFASTPGSSGSSGFGGGFGGGGFSGGGIGGGGGGSW